MDGLILSSQGGEIVNEILNNDVFKKEIQSIKNREDGMLVAWKRDVEILYRTSAHHQRRLQFTMPSLLLSSPRLFRFQRPWVR